MDCNRNSLNHFMKMIAFSVLLTMLLLPFSVYADDDDDDNTPPRTPTVNSQVTNDTTPLIRGTFDSDDARGGLRVTVNGVNYRLGDGNLLASGDNWRLTIPSNDALSDGVYDVSARARDRERNSAYDTTNNELTIDTAAPMVTVSSLITSDTTPALSGTINDPAATIGSCTASHENSNFTNPQLIAGSSLSVGAVYRFSNVFPNGPSAPIDALVQVMEFTGGASLLDIDVNNTGVSKAFQPRINSTNNNDQSVLMSITFVTGGGNYGNEVAISFFGTALDIDGDSGNTREYVEVALPAAYATSSDTVLNILQSATVVRGEVNTSATAPGGNISLDLEWAFSNYFENKSSFTFRIGKVGGSSDRLYSLDMDSANFSNPSSVLINNPVTCGNDPAATINVMVNGGSYPATNNGDGTWTLADDIINALPDGTYNVVVTATDAAGNSGSDTTTNELTIDSTAPIVTVAPLTTNDATPALDGRIDDPNAIVRVTVNGRTYTATNHGDGTWTLADNTVAALNDGTYDVTVVAIDGVGNSGSDSTNNELTIDRTAPTVTVVPLTTNDTTPALSGTVNDPTATIRVTVNGRTYPATNNGNGSWTLADNIISALPDGIYDIAVTATDAAGNSGSDNSTNELAIDSSAPAVTVASQVTNDTTPGLSGTVSDPNATISVTVNGNTYTATNNGNGTWALPNNTINALPDGTYNVVVTATDIAGNSGSDSTINELTIDSTVPAVTVASLTTNDTTPPLSGTVNDPAASISVTVDGNTYPATNNGDGTWTLPDNVINALSDGSYDVTVTATDTAGNSRSETIANALTIDATAPTVTVTALTGSDTTPALSGTIDDPNATISVTVNGNTYPATNNGDGTWTLPDNIVNTLPDGSYDVTVTATDEAGNSGSETFVNAVTIDTTAPAATVTPSTGSDSTPALSGTIDDPNATVTVTINGTDYPATNNGNGTWTLPDNIINTLPDGSYDVTVTATDAVGNSRSETIANAVTIDSNAPAITVTPQITSDATPALSGTIDDPAATINVTVNGNSYPATNYGDGSWTLADNTITPALVDGSYDVMATATDAQNNSGSDGTTNELTIDSNAPTVTVVPLFSSDTTPALRGTIDDPAATVSVTVNGTAYPATNNGDGTWTLPGNTINALPEGTYDVVVTATDAQGNIGSDGTTNELTIDNTAPVVTVTPQTTSDTSPALSGTIDDPTATISVTVNDTAYLATNNGDGTWTLADDTITPALTDGSYDVVVTAIDTADNSDSDSTTNELTVDSNAPAITVTPQTTNDTTPALSGTIDDPAAMINVTVNGNSYPATNNGDGSWTLADNTITPALVDGSYDVLATATDAQNNSGSDGTTNELTIDSNAPTVTVTPLIGGDTTPALSGTIDDPAATVTVMVNGTTYSATNNGDGTWTLPDDIINVLPEGTYDVVVTATDAQGNIGSDGTTNELTIDNSAPIVTVTPQTSSDSTPALSGTIDDPAASVTVTVNGVDYPASNNGDGSWALADNTITPALADGSYDVTVTATDAAGNSSSETIVNAVTIDTTAPAVTVTPSTGSDTTPALSGTIDDPNATVSITVNGATYPATNNGNSTWTLADNTIAVLPDGVYDVVITATDSSGNSGSDGSTNELTVDATAPMVTVTPSTGSDTTPALSGTIDDPTATINVTVNATTYAATNNGDGSWTLADNIISALPDGTYDVVVSATDAVGNSGSDNTSNELTIDSTGPTVTVTPLTTSDTTPALSGTVSDPAATVSVTVNGSAYPATNNGNGSWTLADNAITPALTDGSYDVVMTATDANGNSANDGTTNELTIDTTAPAVTVTPLTSGDTTPALNGTIDDPAASVTVSINGIDYSATNNGDGTWTLPDNVINTLPDGSYDVTVTVTDAVGNSRSETVANALTIDSSAPTISVAPLTTNDTTPALTGTVSDPAATITVTVNGSDYPATNHGDGSWTLADNTITPALVDGSYDVMATATDAAGNSSSDGSSDELTIDSTAPTVTVTSQTSSDSTPALSGTIDDPAATVTVTINGTDYPAINNSDGSWTLADNTITPPLSDGSYDVTVTVTDAAGNSNSETIANAVTIDSNAPAITVTPQTTSDTTPALSGTIDDPTATISVTVNGTTYPATNYGDGSWTLADNTITPALVDGSYDVLATATDAQNNSGSDGTTNELTIDSNAPTVTIVPLFSSDSTPALRGTIDDPAATVSVTVNGTAYPATNNGDGTWTLPGNTINALPEGTYDVVVTATDAQGNIGSDGTTNELTIDNTAPVVTVTPQTTSDTSPALSGTIDDPTATISVTVNDTAYLATNNGDGTWTLADDTITPALTDGSYDVVVTAIDTADNSDSDSTTNELTVDSNAPAITVTPQTTNDTTPALSGTIDDPAAMINVTVNGNSYPATNNGDGSWTLADNTITPALVDGSYDVLATATDAQNNSGSDGTTNELTIDSNAPTVTVTPLIGGDTTPALSGTIDDPAATVTVMVNGTTYSATNNGDGTWTLPDDIINVLPEGTYDVVVTATDAQGNIGSDGTTNELTIDNSAPIVTVTPQTSSDSTPALSGTIDDPAASVTVTINGTDYPATNNGDGTWTLADNTITPALADGSYNVTVTATDAAGNSGSDTTINELTVDSSAPTVTVTPQTTSDTTPGLNGTVSDPAAIISVMVNGNPYPATNNGDGSWTLADNTVTPALADGSYDIVVTATDAVGNSGSDGTTNELTIDATSPTVTVTSLTSNDATPALSGTIDDPTATINVTVNAATYAATNNGDGTWTLADNTIAELADGTYDVVVTATDSSGNSATDNTTNELTVDATGSTITVIAQTTSDSTPVLGGTVSDPTATISVNVNGQAYLATNNGDGTWILVDNTITPPLADGIYDVVATATDAAGNSGSDGTTNELTIDSSAPVITVLPQITSDTTPTLGGTVNDPLANISVIVNGVTYAATNLGNGIWVLPDNTIAPPLVNGTYDVIATATDALGNGSSDGTNNELIINTALATDSDGDGIPNVNDLDDDNDGIPDAAEGDGAVDTDGDGVPDSRDLDSDNDGLFDLAESGADAATLDSDKDGRIDSTYPVGNNGLADEVETAADSGIADYNGADSPLDSDGDTVPDFRDLDSDNDTITDVIEAGDSDPDRNGYIGTGAPPAVNADGVASGAGLTPVDTDGDGLPDQRDVDADGDGVNDIVEARNTVISIDTLDNDGDGQIDVLVDSDMPANGYDDRISMPALIDLLDTDNDGIPDYRDNNDVDNDGISDSTDLDDDNDGIPDAAEGDGNVDTDADGVPDSRDLDSDNDGLFDLVESGADAATLDSDNDGRIDGTFAVGTNGLADVVETAVDSGFVDYNGDTLGDAQRDSDSDTVPDFRDLDSDNDSITDVVEAGLTDPDRNGYIGVGNPPVVNPDGVASGAGVTPPDTDGDGVPDYRDVDSDNDSIRDLVEAGRADLDGDGMIGIIDGFSDADANGFDDNSVIRDVGGLPNSDTDTVPDYRDIDSDDDGVTDLVEAGGTDSNDDGMIDGFNDSNGDGLDDVVALIIAPLPDGDGDGRADYRDSDTPGIQGGAVSPNNSPAGESDTIQTGLDGIGSFDPTLLLLLILSTSYVVRRNRRIL